MEYFGRLSWSGFHTLLREGLSVPWLKGRFDQRYQASANCIPKARRTPITESGSTLCVLGTTCPSNTDPPSKTLRIRKPGGKGVRIHTSLAVIIDTEGALDLYTVDRHAAVAGNSDMPFADSAQSYKVVSEMTMCCCLFAFEAQHSPPMPLPRISMSQIIIF